MQENGLQNVTCIIKSEYHSILILCRINKMTLRNTMIASLTSQTIGTECKQSMFVNSLCSIVHIHSHPVLLVQFNFFTPKNLRKMLVMSGQGIKLLSVGRWFKQPQADRFTLIYLREISAIFTLIKVLYKNYLTGDVR